MPDQENFHLCVGKTIMFCQCIEHDIKWIYAGMCRGNFDDNLKDVENLSLGAVVKKLRDLDNSDGKPYLSADDYKLLSNVAKNIRNHWAHQGYIEYIYEEEKFNEKFLKQYNRLINDHNRLLKLHKQVEQIRIHFLSNR